MLGKLIKYDLKAINRYLIIIHAFLIITSVLLRVFLTGRIFTEGVDFNNEKTMLVLVVFFTAFFLLISAIAFATQLIIAIRFYKNLFSDEGYLTHTLPVTPGEHLLSKTISGCIWGVINMLFLHISMLIVAATPYTIGLLLHNKSRILDELGFTSRNVSVKEFVFFYVLVCLVGVVTNIVLFYTSITIGQLVNSHKVLGSIATYFVISTAFSLIALIVTALSGLLGASIHASESFDFMKYILDSLKMNGILAVIQIAVLYPVAYCIIKKKVNLD